MYTDPIRFAKIKRFFEKRWHFIKTEIDYNEEWERKGIAQYQGLIDISSAIIFPEVMSLMPTQDARAIDNFGRKIIFIGTMLGPVMVYWNNAKCDGYLLVKVSEKIYQCGFCKVCIVTNAIVLKDIIGGSNHHIFRKHSKSLGEWPNIGENIELAFTYLTNTNEPIRYR